MGGRQLAHNQTSFCRSWRLHASWVIVLRALATCAHTALSNSALARAFRSSNSDEVFAGSCQSSSTTPIRLLSSHSPSHLKKSAGMGSCRGDARGSERALFGWRQSAWAFAARSRPILAAIMRQQKCRCLTVMHGFSTRSYGDPRCRTLDAGGDGYFQVTQEHD